MRLTDAQGRLRLLAIVGPTAAGKTELGLALARMFHGEIVNADARQAYQGLSIGTGKPSGIWKDQAYMASGVAHHLMDVVPPTYTLSVVEWRARAEEKIYEIASRRHLPLVVGGTGLYLQALIDGYAIPAVASQPALRQEFESMSLDELAGMLRERDPAALPVVDLKNQRRLIRALEVVTTSGRSFVEQRRRGNAPFDALMLGIACSREVLYARIDQRVERMLAAGWIDEVRRVQAEGVPFDAPAMTSIGYGDVAAYLKHEIGYAVMVERIKRATRRYAKRQLTWFRRDRRIQWIADEAEAVALVRRWLDAVDADRG